MHADENRVTIRVSDCRAIFVRWIRIVVASHPYSKTLPFEFNANLPRESQHHVLLHGPTGPLGAIVGAAVRRVNNDRRADMYGWRGDGDRGIRVLLWRGHSLTLRSGASGLRQTDCR